MIEDLTFGEYVAIWVSIISVIIGLFAIGISIKIFNKTQLIETEQRKNAEGLYVSKTIEYLKEINNYIDSVFWIIENHNKEDDEESDLITAELDLYFRKHHTEMIQVLAKSERSLELWTSLDVSKRDKYNKILLDFNWFAFKFFPLTVKEDYMRTKIWKEEHAKFLRIKYFVDSVIIDETKTKIK